MQVGDIWEWISTKPITVKVTELNLNDKFNGYILESKDYQYPINTIAENLVLSANWALVKENNECMYEDFIKLLEDKYKI